MRGLPKPGHAAAAAIAVALPMLAVSARAAPTSSLTGTGAVATPGVEMLPGLQALPQQTAAVVYGTGAGPVSATFTGPALWSVLGSAGLTPVPGAKNSSLRDVVVATGSDGYAVAFSGGELDPRFGGGDSADLVAYAEGGLPLDTDGFARLVVPGDAAGGRYVSNLVSLQVIDATAVPEPGSLALLLTGMTALASCKLTLFNRGRKTCPLPS